MARQQRIMIDGQHYWIDLVFCNRLTRSFVLRCVALASHNLPILLYRVHHNPHDAV